MGCYGIERRETMSNKTQLQANNETLASILSNVLGLPSQESLKHGAYVWKKMTAEGGDFIDYVVSDQENAYPDGGEKGGYWYEKVVEGKAGIDFGEVTLASYANSITVSHKLGTTPSFVALVPVFADSGGMNPSIDSSYPWGVVAYGNTTERWYGYYTSSSITLKLASGKITKNSNIIKFADDSRWAQGTYKWFAIA